MNKKEKEMTRQSTLKSYHVPSMPNYTSLKKNVIYLNSHSTYKHEIAKALAGMMLLKHGDMKFTPELLESIRNLDKCAKDAMEGFIKEKAEFICEAVPNAEPNRRVDMVILDSDTRVEFETDHKIKKENSVTVYL